jgi:phage tail sheath protein FI
MPTYKTPDVYVEEISVFPPSVAEVETAIPAFIGYTEMATRNAADDLILKPTKIYSLKEYEQLFGGPRDETLAITVTGDVANGFNVTAFTVGGTAPSDTFVLPYLLYYAVKMYFDNGGGQCYIVSVGLQQAAGSITLRGDEPDADGQVETNSGLQDGLDAIALEDEPTLIVIPEAASLTAVPYGTLVQAVLQQCGDLGDRFGIFDAYRGNRAQDLDSEVAGTSNLVAARNAFGMQNLKYGAVYYPYVRSVLNYYASEGNVTVTFPDGAGGTTSGTLAAIRTTNTGVYNFAKAALGNYYVVMPPSGAVAGVYAATDTFRGVWKAPANVSLADVVEPVIRLDNAHQDNLNVDATTGKSINAIRAFAGKGTLVWGARTLAGNDNEWRYISVRRFFNMVEESVKKSTYWAVFESNDANTWVKVRGMIENYLTQKWREGALAGATTKDAFFVRCGLGTTMSAQDILEGRMIVEIGMAVVRPAEFIILKFSHKLQTS